MKKVKVVMSWSGGKDSALALSELLRSSEIEVVGLLTTISLPYDRVTMHGVRRSLVQRQAERIGLPLYIVWLPPNPSNEVYDNLMGKAVFQLKLQGVEGIAFGDIWLEDVRTYREARLSEVGMASLFPLWGKPTEQIVSKFLSEGYSAIVVCVDTEVLPAEFCGCEVDKKFFASLPEGVDPCGERGEFHSFVTRAPFFSKPVEVKVGERVQKGRFVYCDLVEGGHCC